MKKEIKSNEYIIVSANDFDWQEGYSIYTQNLDKKIAFSLFSRELRKVAVARDIDEDQFEQLLKEMNPDNLTHEGLIKANIFGGEAGAEESEEYVVEILQAFQQTGIIELIGYNACERLHPNDIEIDCFHGGVNPYFS